MLDPENPTRHVAKNDSRVVYGEIAAATAVAADGSVPYPKIAAVSRQSTA